MSEFLDEWLDAIRTTLRSGTLRSYRTNVNTHVKPRVGDMRLRSLGPSHLNRMYAELLEHGRANGAGGLSPRTVRYTHAIVHRALRDAVRWGRLSRNPSDMADPPKPNSPEMRVWTVDELRRFLKASESDRVSAAWLLLATTGLRRGELLGLRWEDVDLVSGRAAVVQALGSHAGKLVFVPPKTSSSRRSIVLDPATVDALRRHHNRQAVERHEWGPAYTESGLVFTREDGTPVRPDSFSRRFVAMVEAAGVPPIRLHDVRHTYATVALSAGTHPKVVAERLGHATIAITLDTYSHVLPSLQEQAAARLAELILGDGGGEAASGPPVEDDE